jgi:hypothetical protein
MMATPASAAGSSSRKGLPWRSTSQGGQSPTIAGADTFSRSSHRLLQRGDQRAGQAAAPVCTWRVQPRFPAVILAANVHWAERI